MRTMAIIFLAFSLLQACAGTQPATDRPELPEGHPPVVSHPPIPTDSLAEAYSSFIMGMMSLAEGRRDQAVIHLERAHDKDPESEFILMELINLHLNEGRHSDAERLIDEVLRINPERSEVHVIKGKLLLERKDLPQAASHLERAIELAPENTNAYIMLADLYQDMGQPDMAMQTLVSLSRQEDHAAVAHYYMARLQAFGNNTEAALESLNKALELNPSFISAVSDLGKIYEEQGRVDEAIALYRGYLENNPEEISVRELLVHLLMNKERYPEAKEQLDMILDQDPDRFNALLMTGLVLAQMEKYEEALDVFKRVMESSPPNFEIVWQVGTLQRELKLYEEAIGSFQEAARLMPDRYEPYLNLAVIYDILDRREEALQSLEKGMALAPNKVSLTTFRAQILAGLERYEDAIEVLAEGLKENKDDPAILYQLGIVYDKAGNPSKMEETMRRTIEVDPSHFDAMNYLGYTWAENGIRLDEALELVERALSLKPDAAYIIDSLGWIYFRMGRYEEALSKLLEAYEFMSNDMTVLDHLGDVYNSLGNFRKAAEFWTMALEIAPENDRIRKKLEQLTPQPETP